MNCTRRTAVPGSGTVWRRVRYVLALIGLAAVATCPAAWRDYRRANRAAEARQVLRYLAELVRAERAERGGRLPQQSVGPTPPIGRCCEQGGECLVDPQLWADPGWRALRFTIDDPHRYSYEYEVVDGGRAAVLRAIGDLDCDTVQGTIELRLDPGDDGALIERWSAHQPEE
jgi:type II secretory pathway pseudopilin PulG